MAANVGPRERGPLTLGVVPSSRLDPLETSFICEAARLGLVDHVKTWAVSPRPIDKFGAAEIAPFEANRRHAVDITRGRTSETRPAGRPRTRPSWVSPIGPAGLPVTVPCGSRIPRWMTMPPVCGGRGRNCRGADDHRQEEEPNVKDAQIRWHAYRHPYSPGGQREMI